MQPITRRTTTLCLLGALLTVVSGCAQQTTKRADMDATQQMAALNWQDAISAQTMSPTKNSFLIMMR